MIFARLQFLLLLATFTYCVAYAQETAETAALDEQMVKDCIQKNDWSPFLSLSTQLETERAAKEDTGYFERMHNICLRVGGDIQFSKDRRNAFFHIVSLFLAKTDAGQEFRSVAYLNQSDVVLQLAQNSMFSDKASFESIRSRCMRLVMLFTKRVYAEFVPNYRMQKGFINVSPPDGSGPAGIDPSEIEDPISRAKYEAAIRENDKKRRLNMEQRYLSEIAKVTFPKIEKEIIKAYSEEPIAYPELSEYLTLGGYDDQARRRIFDAVAEKTKVQPPLGLVPTAAEIEKTKAAASKNDAGNGLHEGAKPALPDEKPKNH